MVFYEPAVLASHQMVDNFAGLTFIYYFFGTLKKTQHKPHINKRTNQNAPLSIHLLVDIKTNICPKTKRNRANTSSIPHLNSNDENCKILNRSLAQRLYIRLIIYTKVKWRKTMEMTTLKVSLQPLR